MDAKERIIWAAAEEFAAKGFRGATTRGIAERIGMNHAGINYHFSSKLELYRQAIAFLLDRGHQPLRAPAGIETESDWRRMVADQVEHILINKIKSDRAGQLADMILLREMRAPSETFAAIFETLIEPKIAPIRQCLAMGAAPDAKPELSHLALFSLLAQCVFFAQNPELMSLLTKGEHGFQSAAGRRLVAEHIAKTVCDQLDFQPRKGA
jgi:AcrR family transcriptional regulator